MTNANQEQFQRMVGQRIRLARKELELSQEQVAEQMQIPVRQTLSAIEDGRRKVSAEELVKFMHVLKKELSFFTDPFLLLGEAQVSWRAKAPPQTLEGFERKILPAVAAYRHLGMRLGLLRSVLVPQLPLTPQSSFEQAAAAAERLSQEWGLGKTPALELAKVAEQQLDLLVLMVDSPRDVSGAAVHLPELATILVNRGDPAGRRNYDFGHELFHVLTWHMMPPPRVDGDQPANREQKRRELLAESFTSALLMPQDTVRELWAAKQCREIHEWLKESSALLGVSGPALLWRLVNLGCLSKVEAEAVELKRLSHPSESPPRLYSERFVTCLHRSLDQGLISVRKVAAVLDCTIDDLKDLFRSYGMNPPFDL